MATEGMGVDGVRHSPGDARNGSLSMYSSFTNRNGNDMLWCPDSKFFLLGRRIAEEFLHNMKVMAKKS